ncbi:hypothetical protein BJX64DRAFT_258608 [Aspergillus heterothallicus]
MVEVPWRFAGEQKSHLVPCWILPGSLHSLILGSPFLRATETLTRYISRIKSRLARTPKIPRFYLLGEENQRLVGYLNGTLTRALPDTGSDLMLVQRAYAMQAKMTVDNDPDKALQVEFADGSTAWTSGVVHDTVWNVGRSSVRCDFHVLDDLCVDVVLSNQYLFKNNAFSEFEEYFIDSNSEEDLQRLCNVRLISGFGEALGRLEDDYQQDLESPDAFGYAKIQRELARRDKIRDEIQALPHDRQAGVRLAEAERQRRWEALRQVHRDKWNSQLSSQSTPPQPRTSAPQSRWNTRLWRCMRLASSS